MRNDPYAWQQRKPRAGWQADPTAIAELGIKGAWLLNEGSGAVALDASGQQNTGILNGNAKFTYQGVQGVVFSSSTDYVNIPDSTTVRAAPQFSVHCRVIFNSVASRQDFFSKWHATPSDEEYLLTYVLGTLWFFLSPDGATADGVNSGISPVVGKIYDVWGTYNGITQAIYINGSLSASSAVSVSSIHASTTPLTLGFGLDGVTATNTILSAEIYNRSVSSGEIATLYAKPFWWMRPLKRRVVYGKISGIAYDAISNSGYQSATSSLSWSHIWSGSNRFLAIDIALLSVTDTVSAMTYGGANCTFIGAQNVVGGTGRVESWRICQNDPSAPATGTNTISVTLSGSLACTGCAVSYTGVNQTSPTEAFAGNSGINTGTGTNATVSVMTVENNDWVHAALATSQASGISASQTSRNVVAGTLGTGANSDTGPITPAGSQTMTFTGEGITSAWAIAGYGIRPTSAPGTGSLFQLTPMNGLGVGGPFFANQLN